MFRKTNFRLLIVLFIVLLVIVGVQQIMDARRGDRNFMQEIIQADTAKVTEIILYNPAPNERTTRIFREDGAWKVGRNEKTYMADHSLVAWMMGQLKSLRAERMVARDPDQWEKYEVTDSTGMTLMLKKGNKNLDGIVIGRFDYAQPTNPYDRQGKMTTYLRKYNQDEVFAVDGFLRMSFSDDLNTLRNKMLIPASPYGWNRISFEYPDSSFTLSRHENAWLVGGLAVDSTRMADYLKDISPLHSSFFLDGFTESRPAAFRLILYPGSADPIEISAFPADTTNLYAIRSSANQGVYFSGKEKDLLTTLFKPKGYFLPE